MKKIYFALIVIMVFSCEKDDPDVDIQEPFKIGIISANSVYHKYNPPLQLIPNNLGNYNYSINDSIDVDDDGLYDFVLSGIKRESVMSLREGSEIWVYNKNFEMAYQIIEDSLYHFQYSIDDTAYTAITSAKTNFTPPLLHSKEVEYYGHSEPKALNDGESQSNSFNWINTGTTISSLVNETISDNKYVTLYNTQAANSWNNLGEKYILFRLNKSNLKYYGWIKLEIKDVSTIIIYETYFQKNGF